MNKETQVMLVNGVLHEVLGWLSTRVERLLSATICNERQYTESVQIFRGELWRNYDGHTNELIQKTDKGDKDDRGYSPIAGFVHDYMSRMQGRTLTVIEAVVQTGSLQATKDIACRLVWEDSKYLSAEIRKAFKS